MQLSSAAGYTWSSWPGPQLVLVNEGHEVVQAGGLGLQQGPTKPMERIGVSTRAAGEQEPSAWHVESRTMWSSIPAAMHMA